MYYTACLHNETEILWSYIIMFYKLYFQPQQTYVRTCTYTLKYTVDVCTMPVS